MVIRSLLGYWFEHPDAKDTAHGILQWWLPAQTMVIGEGAVQTALETLVARGWVTQRQIVSSHDSDGQAIYGLNKDRLEEIRHFLMSSDAET